MLFMVAAFVDSCDSGYGGPFCVPLAPLPQRQRDQFDAALSRDKWPEVYGGEISQLCTTLVSGNAIVFYKVLSVLARL